MWTRAARVSIAALLLVASAAAQPPAPNASSPASLLIRHVTLVDGSDAGPRTAVSVVVRDGRVAALVPATPEREPPAELTINGDGLVAIPGLIDAHVHVSGMPWAQRAEQLRRVLRGGVTAIYDVAGDVRNTSDLARAVIAGEIDGPTIYYTTLMAGPAFFTDPRVVGSSLGYRSGEAPWNLAVTPETDLVRAVAAARGAGATGIKLYAALDGPAVGRIAGEAKRQGLGLVAHATVFPAKPSDLVAAGVDMLAHAAYLVWEGSPPSPDFTRRAHGDFAGVPADSPVIEHLLQTMRDHHVALNPTLWILADGPAKDDPTGLRTRWQNAVTHRAQTLGVTIAAGTDDMFDQSVDSLPILHKELEVLVSGAGLTPHEALVAATRGAARAIGVEDQRGTITVGKVADLVLLEANPLDDIKGTRRIRYVVKNGQIVFHAERGRQQ
jgi:imidazolonepropionase-like amidohydrolase